MHQLYLCGVIDPVLRSYYKLGKKKVKTMEYISEPQTRQGFDQVEQNYI
jgi:hypothetical protein